MDALIPGWTQAIESGSSPADVYDDVLEGGGGGGGGGASLLTLWWNVK